MTAKQRIAELRERELRFDSSRAQRRERAQLEAQLASTRDEKESS